MTREKAKFLKRSVMLIDILLTIDAYFLAYYIRNAFFADIYGIMHYFNKYIWILWVIGTLWPIFFNAFHLYDFNVKEPIYKTMSKLFISILLGVISLSSFFYFIGENHFSRLFFVIFAIASFGSVLVGRLSLM